MQRRLHTQKLEAGEVSLSPDQAHHVRKVLRLSDGESVEVFDDAGNVAVGVLRFNGPVDAGVRIERITAPGAKAFSLTIAAAIPKGERADWMIEKLSELGVDTFIPLAAARSVVLPEGRNKHERWMRIATESAKQSRRVGTMRVMQLTPVGLAISQLQEGGWVCSTAGDAIPIDQAIGKCPPVVTLFIGPEGGWTEEELREFREAAISSIGLTQTVLRIETAAVAAASIVMTTRRSV